MPIIYTRNGIPQTKQPATTTKTATNTDCNNRQKVINALIDATKESKNKAVLKVVASVSLLGVVTGIAPAPEYAKQPICMLRASAINQFRAIRGQFKPIDKILTENNL